MGWTTVARGALVLALIGLLFPWLVYGSDGVAMFTSYSRILVTR